MQANYRTDYAGEFVVTETLWSGGQKQQKREWVSNPIENHHISGRAACIGTKTDRHKFDYTILERHRGGLLGSKKLQTYGIGKVANEMRLDFAVETSKEAVEKIATEFDTEKNVFYTNSTNCLLWPEKFYLTPYNPNLLDLSTIVYLAAFDGHKEIFLLGYHRDSGIERDDWYQELVIIMNAYVATQFYFVGEATNMYDAWLDCANAETMTYRQFISYCDI
jgi:hypothetical protein